MIAIQQMSIEDVDNVLQLGQNTLELHDSDDGLFYSKEELSSFIMSPHDILLVAKSDGNFAGFSLTTFNPYAKDAYIIDIAVIENYRKLGIGKSLFEETLRQLEEKGCRWFWCLVEEKNDYMIHFLQKRGLKKGKKFYWLGNTLPMTLK